MMKENKILRDGLVDYLPQIRRIINKIAHQKDVDDISQEVCACVIEKENLWKQERNNLNSWINAITKNMTINHLSKKQTQQLGEREKHLIYHEEKKFSVEQIKWVTEQFQILSRKQRQILSMRYYQNMKVIDISKSLGMLQPNVSRELTSALMTLRKKANSQGFLSNLSFFPVWLQPWNGDHNFTTGAIIMSKLKFLAIILTLCLFGFSGYFFYHSLNNKKNNQNGINLISTSTQLKKMETIEKNETSEISKNISSAENLTSPTNKIFKQSDIINVKKWLSQLTIADGVPNIPIKKSNLSGENRFGHLTLNDLKELKKLNLNLLVIDPDSFKLLKHLKNLVELDLGGKYSHHDDLLGEISYTSSGSITGEHMKTIGELTSLVSLNLNENFDISGEGMKNLSTLTSLLHLQLKSVVMKDQDLEYLSNLKKLKKLDISTSGNVSFHGQEYNLSDTGLKHLENLTNLEDINLSGNHLISDEGLKSLSQMNNLSHLNLNGTKISDKGMQLISQLKKLDELNLSSTKISDEGLKNLPQMYRLSHLNLSNTKISNKGISFVSQLNGLRKLNLARTRISDKGIRLISQLNELRELNLSSTNITNEILKELSALTSLNRLDLSYTTITKQDVQTLQIALPHCKIINLKKSDFSATVK